MSDHFALFGLFGLTPRFALDRAALDAAYRALQAEVHPDKFAHADAATQRQAVERAMRVNEAYQTLKMPVARGAYLLRQAGIEPFDPANTRMSPAFLMQQIEWREQLDAATDVAALETLENSIAEAGRRHEQRLAALLDQEPDLAMATEILRELRFIEKMGEEIQSAFESIDP